VGAEDAIAGGAAAREKMASRARIGGVSAGWLVVAGSMVTLVLLASYHLSTKSFWYDEAFSLHVAGMAPADFLTTLAGREANGSLYYAILAVWRLLGEGEARVRFLSVIFMATTVPLLYLVGRRHVGTVAAGLAVVLFAINPFVIQYAQEARMYGLAMLLVTAAVLAWSHATETDERRWWLAYGVAAAAAVYAHFFAGFVLLGLGITWLLGFAPRTRRSVITQAVIVVTLVPIAVFVGASGAVQVAWITPLTDRALSVVLASVASGSPALAILLYGAATVGLGTAGRDGIRRVAPVAAWWLTPFAIGIAISLVRSAPISAWYVQPRWDWRAAAEWVGRTSRDGDRIAYIEADGSVPMSHYLRRDTDRPPDEVTIDQLRSSTGRAWLVLYLLRGSHYAGLEATLPGYRVVQSKLFDGVRVQLIDRTS
jgi:Dolichyl-phosphate-mannose-protein mannosyltransferase